MSEFISISQASALLGVSEKTLRAWDTNDKLPALKTAGGHRRYDPVKLREFLKTSYKQEVVEDFDIAADAKKFFTAQGYIKDSKEDDGLVTLLTTLMKCSTVLYDVSGKHNDSITERDFALNITSKIWHQDLTKNIVPWQPMLGPTGLIFYLKHVKNNLPETDFNAPFEINMKIVSEEVAARTRKIENCQFRLPSDSELVTVLDPVTFETKQHPAPNGFKPLQQEEVATVVANRIVKSLSKEIISDFSNYAKPLKITVDRLFDTFINDTMKIKTIVVNELGYRVISKTFPDIAKIADINFNDEMQFIGMFAGVGLYYSPDVPDNEILVSCNDVKSPMHSAYVFAPYVLCTMSPVVVDKDYALKISRGVLCRYGKKLLPNQDEGYMSKIYL